ncbi:hypothetical protein PTTG_29907 [Puccinia triticina 1-1 BBBD Race 1]|uniref:Uncharacterized protein n=1 Tax=Puccinia triticina (isolate 1-1 / race 1 (BBBD)) TaxID=630390 RepID=A0A180G1E4_PUCT1|nr:hypothetical protein PTTG_29907 [Puccinia triticina 1-1 BBBD Race 1]
MDLNLGEEASDTNWVLEILPAVGSPPHFNNTWPDQRTLPGEGQGSLATIHYNRTVLAINPPYSSDGPPTFRRRTIWWTERLCVELIKFFGAWFSQHKELVEKSSTFLVKATYFANFQDVLRAYPGLNGYVQIIKMKAQYTHLCKVWKTITDQMKVSPGDPMPVDFLDRVSRGGMSPQVYILLKDAIEERRHIETPLIIPDSPEDKISKSTAACASFLVSGIQAESSASQ